MALVCAFAVLASYVDAKKRVLPNALLLAMALSALAMQGVRLLGGAWLAAFAWEAALDARIDAPWMCGLLAVVACALLVGLESWRRGRGAEPGLGFGDAKLAFCWTLALGLLGVWGFALGCGSGAVVAKLRRQSTFALGPWVSGWCVALAILVALPPWP